MLLRFCVLLLLALGSPAAPVRAATLEIFSAPYTTDGRRDTHSELGFLITILRFIDPIWQERENFLSTNHTGFDNAVEKIRVEREDGQAFRISHIGIGALYTGAGVAYRNQSEYEVVYATWNALVLTYSTGGVIGETRISPWAPSDAISYFGDVGGLYEQSLAPLRVNLNRVDWVEMTLRWDPIAEDPCNRVTRSGIVSPTLAADARIFCAGGSVPGFGATPFWGQRNDAAFAGIRNITVPPIPLPAGFWLLGSALLIFAGYGLRLRRRSAQSGS